MIQTNVYKFQKPEPSEKYNIAVHNANMDAIDLELDKLNKKIGTTVTTELSDHNTSGSAHNDLRLLLTTLSTKLNRVADSTDPQLDQLSEIVTYIKNNKSLIDQLVIDLREKADLEDVYTKNESDKVVADAIARIVADAPEDFDTLKEMSDWIAGHTEDVTAMNSAIASNTTAIGELQNGKLDKSTYNADKANYDAAYEHSQSAHAPSNAQQNVQSDWNATSGDAFIKNKPSIPTKTSDLTNDSGFKTNDDGIVAYGTCTTAAATAAKTVTISNNEDWKLKVGVIVAVKFSYSNTASNCTLNVNNTGAKSIWYNTTVYTGTSTAVAGYANKYIYYMYDGTYWVWFGQSIDSNTTYSNFVKSGSGAKSGLVPAPSTTAGNTKYLREDGTWAVPPGSGGGGGGSVGQGIVYSDTTPEDAQDDMTWVSYEKCETVGGQTISFNPSEPSVVSLEDVWISKFTE